MSIETAPLTTLGAAAQAVVSKLEEKRIKAFEPGVYFNMPESEYFSDPALGSSSVKALADNPTDWWWSSPFNTLEADEDGERDTPSQILGTAVHKILLEGMEAFEATYAVQTEPGNTKAGKEQKAFIESQGKKPLRAAVYRRAYMIYHAIQANPQYADAFRNGIPETSVFWERDGIRFRARFDYLRIKTTVDLKTVANERGKPFRQVVSEAMATWSYNVQAALYREGRTVMRQLAKDGRVFGDHDADLFARIVENESWSSTFVFVQSKGAPNIAAPIVLPDAALLDDARMALEVAEKNYKEWSEKFGGVENPWISLDEPYVFDVEDMPSWWQYRRRVA